jgi:hypothetical protein
MSIQLAANSAQINTLPLVSLTFYALEADGQTATRGRNRSANDDGLGQGGDRSIQARHQDGNKKDDFINSDAISENKGRLELWIESTH